MCAEPGRSCVIIDPSTRLETSYTRTGRPRRRCRCYGEIFEGMLQDSAYRLRSEQQVCG